jgi:hypothetical protein
VCIKATTFLAPLPWINISISGIRPYFPFCFYLVFLCLLFIIIRLDHLATPLNSNLIKYSTRRNSEGLVNVIPKPEQVYRRRLAKATSRRILSHLGSASIFDIHFLFVNNCISEMDIYDPCDFSNINGYPHAILEKTIEKLPSFQGNNAISAKMHVKYFMRCINKWCVVHDHEDVKMKLFILSL